MGNSARRALGIAVLAVLCVPAVARTQAAIGGSRTDPPPQQAQAPVRDDGCRTVVRLPANFLRATLGVFNGANLNSMIVGSDATGFAALYDQPIAEALDDPDSTLGTGLATGGRPRWSGVVVGALFVGGRFASGTRFRAASYDWLEAYVVNLGYTGTPEGAGRTHAAERPGRQVFPVGSRLERVCPGRGGRPPLRLETRDTGVRRRGAGVSCRGSSRTRTT